MAAEHSQGGVCGGMWCNPPHNRLSGGGTGGLPSPCSVAQPVGACDTTNSALNFSPNMDSALEFLDNAQWDQQNLCVYSDDSNGGNFDAVFTTDSRPMMNSDLFSNSPQDSSTITNDGDLKINLLMSPSASYLIQPSSNYNIHESQPKQSSISQLTDPNIDSMSSNDQFASPCCWAEPTSNCTAMNGHYSITSNSLSKTQSNLLSQNLDVANEGYDEEVEDTKSNINGQTPNKKPRIEAPSPLPTFKTDTASVLHEAIEYIKFLHVQVNDFETLKNKQNDKRDLRSRGLCLIPLSRICSIAQESQVDFWAPTFGGVLFR